MPATGETISVLCGCGKKLKAPASAVGRKAKCPACGSVVTIAPPPPPPPPAPEDDPLAGIYDLAEAEKQAASSNQIDDSPRCPQCGAEMGVGAVLCVNCGYDVRAKGKVGAAPAAKKSTKPVIDPDFEKKAAKNKPKDKMAPTGNFFVGVGVCAAFAAALGIIWFMVTWYTWDMYFLSIPIGIAAGVGMQIGQKGFSHAGGTTAAGIALAVMIIARVAIALAILQPSDSGGGNGDFDDRVVTMMEQQELKAKNIDPDESTESQDEAAHKAAISKLKKMSKSEYQALLAKAEDEEVKEELAGYVTEDVMKERQIDITKTSVSEMKALKKEVDQRIAAMTPEKRKAELKKRQEADGEVADSKKHKSDDSDTGDTVAKVGLFIYLFRPRVLICMVAALGVCYRTASGTVSST